MSIFEDIDEDIKVISQKEKLKVLIEAIDLEDINQFGKEKYNSNNHWVKNKPNDYMDKIQQCSANHWIHLFRKYYHVINIEKCDIKWMRDANKICSITGHLSKQYADEIDDLVKRYETLNDFCFSSGTKYFVRTNSVSLKEGKHGCNPYTNFRDIIESMVTCKPEHSPLNDDHIQVYLLPWVTIDKDKEFRIFVHKNQITAISQQHLYQTNDKLAHLSKDDAKQLIEKWVNLIVNYFNDVIVKKITHIDTYTIDLALIEKDQPFFIEINVFGKEYAAGSSLFHWLLDEEKLYGKDPNVIYFRYTK